MRGYKRGDEAARVLWVIHKTRRSRVLMFQYHNVDGEKVTITAYQGPIATRSVLMRTWVLKPEGDKMVADYNLWFSTGREALDFIAALAVWAYFNKGAY